MESMLVWHTGTRSLPPSSHPRTTTTTKNPPWRRRCSVSRLPSSCEFLTWANKTQQLFNRRFEWRCQAAVDELEEEVETAGAHTLVLMEGGGGWGCAVLVVGGGVLGMETVRALVDAGLLVAAYQRGETFDIPEMFHDDIEEMGWDVIDVTTVKKVLESNPFEAVVCTVGGAITRPDSDKDVPVKLVNAAKTAGVKRIVLVSSIGASDSVKDADEMTFKEVAEEAVKSSELNYTIIRPGGLLSTPPTGNGILTEKAGISGLISRADVAALIMEVLFNKNSYGKTLTAIDEDKLLPPTSSLDGVELISL